VNEMDYDTGADKWAATGTPRSFCTRRGCMARAYRWATVRVEGLDELHARCAEHI
jgi:hypothetical protein